MRKLAEYAEANLWVFTAKEEEVVARAGERLAACGYKALVVGQEDWFVYAPGEIPVLLVAHADTAHGSPPDPATVFYDREKGVLWSPEGLGADDRAGVLGILWLVEERGLRPHVAVTRGEESGCVGARRLVATAPDLGVFFAVELDRKNGGEAVFYQCENPEFERFVLGYGFEKAQGSFSDISVICPAWGVAGVNLSCGYYNAHTNAEFLLLRQLGETLEKVERMLRDVAAGAVKKRFPYVAKKPERPKLLSRFSPRPGWDCDELLEDYSRYLWRYDSSSYNKGVYPISVTVDPAQLAVEYGGREEEWEELIDLLYDELVREAEDAVYTYIHRLASKGEIVLFDDKE